ncbi:MAG: hypothetical protein H6722_17360 [Sandaracinus sp.]|jgi:hypothetical protein|nr:hypothetical protein [Sandaracinus sp.]MCB9614209.1 hypothetical protein [Sandaracinus sp.]MCB9620098.1 hypothetical protein [Sandaracinus sp.]MCB9622530.1 hypothetical protein [Sandaracinus sp.]
MDQQGDVLKVVEAGMLAGVRPTWTVAGCSLAIGFGMVPGEGAIAWLGHPLAMVLCCGFAVFEWLHARDAQASALSALGFARSGLAAAAALAAVATMAGVENVEVGPLEMASGGGGAALIATLRGTIRDRVKELAHDAASAWVARLEDGGFVLFATLLFVFPLLPLLVLIVFAIAAAIGFAFAMVADRAQRRVCGACGHRARAEAVRCPSCQRGLEPKAWLQPPPRMSAHVEALFAEPPKKESAT